MNYSDLIDMIASFKKRMGAISVTEALGIYQAINSHFMGDRGCILETGGHAGKSSIAIARACRDAGIVGPYFILDPLYDIENASWDQTVQKSKDNIPWDYTKEENFVTETTELVKFHAGDMINVALIGKTSYDFLPRFDHKISVMFVDSDIHTKDQCVKEVELAKHLLKKDALVIFHDYGNFSGPVNAARELVSTGEFESFFIGWTEIIQFVKEHDLEKGNNSWHQTHEETPNYLGVIRKV